MNPISIALGLAQFVPSIVRWVAGDKAGDAAQTVVGIAQAVTGKATGPEALAAIQADQEAQRAFQERMATISVELDRFYLLDRQDARKTEVALAGAGASNAKRKNLMIIMDVVGLLACLGAMVYSTWLGVTSIAVSAAGGSPDVSPIIMALNGPLGMLTQQFGLSLRDAHNYEFGSSQGSRDKDALLASAPSFPRGTP